MKFYQSLRFKMSLIMILLLLVPLMLIGFLSYQQTKVLEYAIIPKSSLEEINPDFKGIFADYEQFLTELTVSEELKSNTYSFPDKMAKEITNMPAANDPLKTQFYETYLSSKAGDYENTLNLYFATEGKGEFYLSNIPPSEVDLRDFDPRQRDWYLSAKEANGKAIWTDPYIDTGTGKSTITLAKAFKNENGNIEGVAGLDFDMHKLALLIRGDILNKSLIIAGLSVLAGLLIVYIFMKNFIKRLGALQSGMYRLAKGDLSVDKLYSAQQDELGMLVSSYNEMMDHLKELITNVIDTSQQVAASAEQLNANADEVAKATDQIAGSIQEVSEGTEGQAGKVAESREHLNLITDDIREISSLSGKVAQSSEYTAARSEEGMLTVNRAIKQMEIISQNTDETGRIIHMLDEKSAEIEKILSIISQIADQTNLLALNAAIEAARAGEHGKGFAVVADEVRKLAEQSSASAKQISSLILDIQDRTKIAVESISKGERTVKEGIILFGEAWNSFDGISAAVKETYAQMERVSGKMKKIQLSTSQLSGSFNTVDEYATHAALLTQEVAGATEEQSAAIQEVSSATGVLADMAQELHEKAMKFKI
ncbi:MULTISPECIES: methyl-accepting chemotaxis protein [Cytobacillus]|uniref:methyl-accepting chemotaxis protein n=1 Tax=Cytobacillus TaxID=2675230 RepID=UPI0020402FD8|nr:methyl-accepting chemotaxis protein [Cytobacillus firmus]MCM3706523.1 methyl-accepting chemotaxis protein [Cytobacillus firmus]